MASTSEIKKKKKILNLFMHHQSKFIKKIKKKKKRNSLPLACVLFVVNGYFRIQRNLFNYLWSLIYFAYNKEIPNTRASKTSLM